MRPIIPFPFKIGKNTTDQKGFIHLGCPVCDQWFWFFKILSTFYAGNTIFMDFTAYQHQAYKVSKFSLILRVCYCNLNKSFTRAVEHTFLGF